MKFNGSRKLRNRQEGVALFIAMVALVVLMISAVALIRSTDTAQQIAGGLAIKRDLTHESELAIQDAFGKFGALLSSEQSRWNDVAGANYYAGVQPSNPQGLPWTLVQATVASETPLINGITYRYLIERMCPAAGSPNLPTAHCITGNSHSAAFISDADPIANAGAGLPSGTNAVVYRISVRLTDPRSTQSFFQTTFMSNGG